MDVRSLGLDTDLTFHRYEGEVIDRGEYLVVRTAANPGFRWGNMLLFPTPPAAGDVERWEAIFRRELGDAPHRVYTWDVDPDDPSRLGEGDLAPFLAVGFRREATVVMTATAVTLPPRPHPDLEVRPLRGEAEWREVLELQMRCRPPFESEAGFRRFREARMTMYRRLEADGLGHWFGAFLEGRMVADMGLFVHRGVGRFQSVETDPDFRRRGICGTAVAAVARTGFARLGAHTLVMQADPDDHAAGIYASVGFRPSERLLGLEWRRQG